MNTGAWLLILGAVLFFGAVLYRVMRVLNPRRLQRMAEMARRASDIAAMTLQNMDQGLIMVDAQGAVLVYNQGFLDFTGITPQQAQRCKTFEAFVRSATTAPVPHDIDRVLQMARSGGTHSYEVTLGNGKVYDVRQTALETGGFIRTYTDISERKLMEHELLKSRDAAESASALMNTTMQNMDQGILVVDAALRIVMYNEKVLDLLRKERSRVHPNISLEDFFRLGDVDEVAVQRAMRLADLGDKTYYELNTLDGRTLAVRQNPLREGGWVRTYTDISESKAVEAQLRQSKGTAESTSRILETTLQNLGQGILMVDAAGNIVTYNKQLIEYLGIDELQVAGCKTFVDLVRLGDVSAYFKDRTLQLGAQQGPGSFEFPLYNGRILQVTQNPLQEGGWVRTYSDITARKRIEQELQHAMVEAEASSQAKAAFLATMSHEIRTPMNGIIGMVDLLSQSRLNEDQVRVVRTIRDSGHALLTILDDVLDLSKIEAGKLQLELVEMSIRETVEGAAATLSVFAARNDIQLVIYVDPEIADRVHGDPVRIRQIIFNLLSNAIKFSRKGSEVLVRVDPVTASDEEDMKAVCFTVTDHGVGIPKRAQANLFESFIQAETSTTRRFGGTGLGLAICKRLTTMMRGSINFRSVEGEGTTFFIDLKFKPVTGPSTGQRRELQGLEILLVGKSEMQCFAAAQYLVDAGAEVHPSLELEELPRLLQEAVAQGRVPAAIVLLDTNRNDQYRRIHRHLLAEHGRLPAILLAQSAGMLDNTGKLGSELLLEINPLRRDNLIRAVAIACGRDVADSSEQFRLDDVADVPLPTVDEALEAGRLVLVAEDNSVNQDVIRRQLNRLGYQCELAANGREALEWWRTRSYAILLTDCHMPEMDGFDLAQAIRKEENHAPRKRTPIVAITANALKGEAERCLAAGMDDYLAKPLKLRSLQELLLKWLGEATPLPRSPSRSLEHSFRRQLHLRHGARATARSAQEALPILDERVIKDELGEDPQLFREILAEFSTALESGLAGLEEALLARAHIPLRDAAHKLKSACSTVGAARLAALCQLFEQAASKQDWHGIDAAVPDLAPCARELRERVGQYR